MKSVRPLVLGLTCVFVLTTRASAERQPFQFIQLSTVRVKPGVAATDFEYYLKKVVAARNKVGGNPLVFTYSMGAGGPSFTYMLVTGFDKFGERDSWPRFPQLLIEVYGETEGAKILKMGLDAIEHDENEVYRTLLSSSTRPKLFDPPTNFAYVIRTEVDPQMVSSYELYLAKVKAAQEQDSTAPTAIRSVTTHGPSFVYITFQFFNKWSERDTWPNAADTLRKAYGEEEARQLAELSNRCIKKRDTFVLGFRPELSRPTSN